VFALHEEALKSQRSFDAFADRIGRQIVKVCKKYTAKAGEGVSTIVIRGGPGDLRTGRSQENEAFLRSLKELDQLKLSQVKRFVVASYQGDITVGAFIKGAEGLKILEGCRSTLNSVPEDEPDWDQHWQDRLDFVLVVYSLVQAYHIVQAYTERIKKYVDPPSLETVLKAALEYGRH